MEQPDSLAAKPVVAWGPCQVLEVQYQYGSQPKAPVAKAEGKPRLSYHHCWASISACSRESTMES